MDNINQYAEFEKDVIEYQRKTNDEKIQRAISFWHNTERENLYDIKDLISVIKSGKEKHTKRTGEMICVEVTFKVGEYVTGLYLEVINYTTNLGCKKWMNLDDFVNSEDPRSVFIDILGNAMRETSEWYACNEEVCDETD